MNFLNTSLLDDPIAILGWTLIHFVWQGTLVALLLAGFLATLLRSSSIRYAAACAALLIMLVIPFTTASLIAIRQSKSVQIQPSLSIAGPGRQGLIAGSAALPSSQQSGEPSQPEELSSAITTFSLSMRWLILAWLVGVLFCSVRLFGGWLYTKRLRSVGVNEIDTQLINVLSQLIARLRVTRPIRLLSSTLVKVPTAIGWLRPTILIPISALSGLTHKQLEALLAHELAHIRRFDYLVNFVQVVIETLFFYHPAVWWVSKKIREEREDCCDDIAVSLCGDAVAYARALVEMEQLRYNQLALAANGGVLMNRIHRLIGIRPQPAKRFSLVVGILSVAVTVWVSVAVGAQIMTSNNPSYGDSTTSRASEKGRTSSPDAVFDSSSNSADPGSSALSTPRPSENPAEPQKQVITAGTLVTRSADSIVDFIKDQIVTELENQLPQPEPSANPNPAGQAQPAPKEEARTDVSDSLTMLASSDPMERATGACQLGRLGAVEAIPPLIKLLDDETPIATLHCWNSGSWSPAIQILKQSSPGEQAAIALASLSRSAVEPLINVLVDPNPVVRRNAAWAIGEIRGGSGVNRSKAVEPLIGALDDPDSWVRLAAAFSLGEMRPRRSTDALVRTLGDINPSVREMAARALGEMKSNRAVESLSVALLRDDNEQVRRKAAWALGEIKDQLALDALTTALNDHDLGVRAMAKWAISEIQDTE
jgi:HEAT repeat protein/beta-lactamase regulating signal transducer with metallopeptidase domain